MSGGGDTFDVRTQFMKLRRRERFLTVVRPSRPRPDLHTALRRPLGAPPPPSGPLWPLLVLFVIAAYALAAAELSGAEGWPLAVLMATPVAALAYDAWTRRAAIMARVRRRKGRIVADQRPVLMRAVLVLGDQRPARLIRRLPAFPPQIGDGGGRPASRGGRGRIVRRIANGG